jgi:hypothetical protein
MNELNLSFLSINWSVKYIFVALFLGNTIHCLDYCSFMVSIEVVSVISLIPSSSSILCCLF